MNELKKKILLPVSVSFSVLCIISFLWQCKTKKETFVPYHVLKYKLKHVLTITNKKLKINEESGFNYCCRL